MRISDWSSDVCSSDLTDHFEKHVLPRPGTRWDMVSAVMAHDAQMAAGGITTSFDCVCVGVSIKHPERREIFRPMIDAVREASTKGMLRADPIVHLRCAVKNGRASCRERVGHYV